ACSAVTPLWRTDDPSSRLDRRRDRGNHPARHHLRADPEPAPAGAVRAPLARYRRRDPVLRALARSAWPIRRPGRDRLPAFGALRRRVFLHPRRAAALLDRDLGALGTESGAAQRLALLEQQL